MYDLIIIGAGPAGLTAAIYAARYGLKTMVVAKVVGGLILDAYKVCNYPGFDEVSGIELMEKFKKQAEKLKVVIKEQEVVEVKLGFNVTTKDATYSSKSIILALGTQRRKLNLPEEEKFLGKGISYCATCDAAFFEGADVGVVGGSNATAMAAELLASYAKKVYIIYRKDMMRAEPFVVRNLEKNRKVQFIYSANVKKLKGDKFLEEIELDTGKKIKIKGLFIEIGSVPSLAIARNLNIKIDKEGYIIVDKQQKTNIPGVFAAGDITNNPLKQVVAAAGQGAVAAISVFEYLRGK